MTADTNGGPGIRTIAPAHVGVLGGGRMGAGIAHAFLLTPEGLELAAAFPKIKKARVRRRILDLVRAMVEDEAAEQAAPDDDGDVNA